MRVLLIYDGSLYSRHELGYIASLKLYGIDLLAIMLDETASEVQFVKEIVEVDEKPVEIPVIKIPQGYPLSLINAIIDNINIDPHVVITMPRKPYLIAMNTAKAWNVPLIARFWSIRALKLFDNLRHGAYSDILLFVPSFSINYIETMLANGVIVTDYPMYSALKRLGISIIKPVVKIYPPAGFRPSNKLDNEVIDIIKSADPYAIAMTVLSKRGVYLKFEARPHALLFYYIAKRIPWMNFIIGGSNKEEFIHIFPQLMNKIPKNLIFIGRGFTDDTLKILYRHSLASVNFISNRSISNRLLEALALGTPVVVNSMALTLHPELKGNILIADLVNNYIKHLVSLYKSEIYYEDIKARTTEAYHIYFSPKVNALTTNTLVTLITQYETKQ